jgi:hypothetical protein
VSGPAGQKPAAVFVTLLGSAESEPRVRLAVSSLRRFGGPLAASPVLVFAPGPLCGSEVGRMDGVEVVELELEPSLARYPFGVKVVACAQAEARLPRGTRSLVWLGPGCLVVNPPELFSLGPGCDAALRPVHIANIGSTSSAPLDEYWSAVYEATDAQDGGGSVESFLDGQRLRPYYNTHCFSVNLGLGLLAEWRRTFEAMVADAAFQAGPCRDEPHRIFLHQAVLSALITKSVAPGRLQVLPPSYSYPLHFHAKLAGARRVRRMNDIVCAAYEEDSDLSMVPVDEPLRSWLRSIIGHDGARPSIIDRGR